MKNLIICYLISIATFAQNSVEITYNIETNFPLKYQTKAILKIVDNKSHYIVLKSKNSSSEFTITDENGGIAISAPESDKRPVVLVDLEAQMLYSYVPMFQKYNLIKETLPKIKWKIINEYKDFKNLKCQKANGYFRGRNYTAWFSKDIPLPFGPWKLNGLPGLIIEAKDDKNQVYFTASKISYNKSITIEDFPSEKKAVALKTFISEIIPKKFEELESKMNSKSDRDISFTLHLPDRNNAKEITFEWEEEKTQN